MLTTNNDKPSPERPIHANEIKCNVLSGALWYCGSADLMSLFQWSATLQLNASVSQLYGCLSPTASILLQPQATFLLEGQSPSAECTPLQLAFTLLLQNSIPF